MNPPTSDCSAFIAFTSGDCTLKEMFVQSGQLVQRAEPLNNQYAVKTKSLFNNVVKYF